MPRRSEKEPETGRTTIDVWLREVIRGEDGRVLARDFRLFAQRPSSAPEGFHGDRLRAVLQPVEEGTVQAWHPIWEEWLAEEEIALRVENLLRDGWTLNPKSGNGYSQAECCPRLPRGLHLDIAHREKTAA